MKAFRKFLSVMVLLLTSLWAQHIHAQISEGGLPPSFKFSTNILKQSRAVDENKAFFNVPINFDVAKLKEEDLIREASGKLPRIAYNISVDITMNNNGEWSTLTNGQKIWQLTVKAKGALATMLYYDDFYIPKGGKLFIYNTSKTQVLGAYTSKNNPRNKKFATELLGGDEFVIEYVAPLIEDAADKPRINIEAVGYGYRGIDLYGGAAQLKSYNDAYGCLKNINCPEGANWQHQKKGVVQMLIRLENGTTNGSGSVINNTKEDFTPYLLTAYHCVGEDVSLDGWIFYFHYELPSCAGSMTTPLPKAKTMVGGDVVTKTKNSGGGDGALVKLREKIPLDYNAFYNGWDRRNEAATSGVGIHHPRGDAKKITTYTQPATTTQFIGVDFSGAPNAHWKVIWADGFTEGGSSGSPLFNQNGLIVGSLSGAPTAKYCGNAGTNYSMYGKLWYNWDRDAEPEKRMNKYLDPENSGQETLRGVYERTSPFAGFELTNSNFYIGSDITIRNESIGARTYKWSFPGADKTSSTDAEPQAVKYSATGTYTITLIINEGLATEETTSKTFEIIERPATYCSENIAVGTTSANTAEFPFGITKKYAVSSSIYTMAELENREFTINSITWEAKNSVATRRNVQIYMKEVDSPEQISKSITDDLSGATLVYKSLEGSGRKYLWFNDSGKTTIELNMPFTYSGTQHLKVIVVVEGDDLTYTRSSECYYTPKDKSHMEWLSDATVLNKGQLGIVTNNRPNIVFTTLNKCTPSAENLEAIIDFGDESTVFYENFDTSASITDWTIRDNNSNVGIALWRLANLGAAHFKEMVDPTSVNSAGVAAYGGTGQRVDFGDIDTWLISRQIDIPQGTKISFYAGYRGLDLDKSRGSFHISTDDGETWTQIWTAGNIADPNLGLGWRKMTFDLSSYANSKVRLGWRFEGNGGYYFLIDNIKVYYENSDQKQIFVNEHIDYVSRSKGNPTNWLWTMNGGNPSSSQEEHNRGVKYLTAGDYNTSLTIKDKDGNTSSVTKSISIKPFIPVPEFTISGNGFTKYPDYGCFLPTAGESVTLVSSVDGTKFPKIQWSIDGVSMSTASPFTTSMTNNGNFKVALTVNNSDGNIVKEKTNYIIVGETADIWNMDNGDLGNMLYNYKQDSLHYATGGNPLAAAHAERFYLANSAGSISKLNIRFKKGANNGEPLTITICNEKNGIPDEAAPLTSIQLAIDNIQERGYTTIALPQKVRVNEAFYVIVSGMKTLKKGEGAIAVFASKNTNSSNSGRVKIGGVWKPYASDVLVSGKYSLNIVPTYSALNLSLSTENILLTATDTNEKTVSLTGNVGSWTATTSSNWIKLENINGLISESIKFKCTENFSYERSGIITINADGIIRTIEVTQKASNAPTMPAPIDLTATIVGNDANDVELTWSNPALETDQILPNIEIPMVEEVDDIELKWHNDDFNKAQRLYSTTDYKAMTYFDSETLAPYVGGKLKQVKLYICSKASYKILIYKVTGATPGGSTTYDPNPVSSQETTLPTYDGTNKWYTFDLSEPIDIKTGDKYLVGYQVSNHTDSGVNPTAYATSTLDGKSFYQATSSIWSAPSGASAGRLYLISAVVEKPAPAESDNATLQWYDDNGSLGYSAGWGSPYNPYTAGAKWDVNDLAPYIGYLLNEVKIHINAQDIDHTIGVYINDTKVHSQAVERNLPKGLNSIALVDAEGKPVNIKINQGDELLISLTISNYGSSSTTSRLALRGPAGTGKGNLYISATTGKWTVRNGNNWVIAPVLTKSRPASGIVYNLYRDGNLIAKELSETKYTDVDLALGNYCYTVKAKYWSAPASSDLSALSNEACVAVKNPLIVTADNKWRYAGVENSELTFTYSGFLDGDTADNLTTKPKASTDATINSPSGDYDIVLSNGVSDKYSFIYNNAKLTIKEKTIPTDVNAVIENNVDVRLSWVNSDANVISYNIIRDGVTVASGITSLEYTDTNVASGNHSYQVVAVYGEDIISSPSVSANVFVKYLLSVKPANVEKFVGENNPAFELMYTGFVDGDTSEALTRKPVATSWANASSLAGVYPITPSGGVSDKYRFKYVDGTLTIKRNASSITLTGIEDKVYGDLFAISATHPGGLVKIESEDNSIVSIDGAGEAKAMKAGAVTIKAVFAGNDSYAATSATGVLTIMPAKLTATASNVSRIYGEANPEFAVVYNGFKFNDNVSSLDEPVVATTNATNESPSGEYIIAVTGGFATNYIIETINAKLNITKRAVTVMADSQSKLYGEADPVLTYTLAGTLIGNDVVEGSLTRAKGESVGEYSITQNTLSLPNSYEINFIGAKLIINKASQSISFDASQLLNKKVGDSFLLTGTSDSGLNITFESSDSSVASIDVSGKITINKAGTVIIIAKQAGNANYEAAKPVSHEMLIEENVKVELLEILVNGVQHDINEPYVVNCGDTNDVEINVETNDGVIVNIPKNYKVIINKPSVKYVDVILSSADGSVVKAYILKIEKRFDFNSIVKQRWNNTLAVINNSDNNGGYKFESYRWYKNGELVGLEQSYSVGKNATDKLDPSDVYEVEMVTSEGEVLHTCQYSPIIRSFDAKVYPIPANQNEVVYVEIDIDTDLLEDAVLVTYSLTGQKVGSQKVTGRITPVGLPTANGTYIIKVLTKEFQKDLKVIVK